MKLRRLTIRRMPGFEDRGLDPGELSDTLNVIIGPNGSGKTTCCRAIRGLLWPGTLSGARPVDVVGQWDDAGAALRLEVQAGRATCQRDGADADWPDLPPEHLAKCFTITIDDLFEDKGTETDLAGRLWREMAGGYDLRALRDLDWVDLKKSHGRIESDALRSARMNAGQIADAQRALQDEEGRLDSLQDRQQRARRASQQLARLQAAEELLDLHAQADAAERDVNAFGPGLDLLHGDEAGKLAQLRDDIETCRAEQAQADAAAGAAEKDIARAALGQTGIEEAQLAEQTSRLVELDGLRRDLADAQRRLAEDDGRLASEMAALGPRCTEEKLAALDASALANVEKFHRQSEELICRRDALNAQLAALPAAQPADLDLLVQAIAALSEWLRTPAATTRVHPRKVYVTLAIGLFGAAAGLVLGATLSAAHFLLTALGVAFIAAYLWSMKPDARADRGLLRDQYARLGLPAPDTWDSPGVTERLLQLQNDLAQARQAEAVAAQRQAVRGQLAALAPAEADLEIRRQRLIAATGVAADTANLALAVLAGGIQAALQARHARDARACECDLLRERYRQALAQANDFLVRHGAAPTADFAAIKTASDSLAQRARLHLDASRRLAEARRRAAAAREAARKLLDRQAALFAAAGLADHDDDELHRRLRAVDGYRDATRKLARLAAQRDALTAKLADEPELASADRQRLSAMRADAEALAAEYKPLVEQTADIRRRVNEVRSRNSLEVAQAEVDWATQQLDSRRRQAEIAAAATMLLDEIESEHRTEGQPAVMKQAGRWFTQFTRGRYELRLDNQGAGGAGFRAIDHGNTRLGEGLALEQLSRGTYMQLLLAVRMAFAAAAERDGRTLPFVLDEVLSSTDPARFRAVIECLLTLVAQGCQVFYFTCQPGDAAAWQQVADESGTPGARRIDLAEAAADGAGASRLLTASTAQAPALPGPEGRSLADYAALLAVPALDGAAGSAGAHLAHLLDDAQQLHRLLSAGVATCGQLRCLAQHGGTAAFLDAAAMRRVQARAAMLDAFAEGWRIGRGKKLTPEALDEAGVSDRLLDRIASLAAELDGNAARLVDALNARQDERAKGFRAAALEEMIDKLTESGHLDPRPALTADELRSRVLAAAGPFISDGAVAIEEASRMLRACQAAV